MLPIRKCVTVLVSNCQAMGYRYYASYPAHCMHVVYLMLRVIQCEMVKVCCTMYIVHQIMVVTLNAVPACALKVHVC